MQTSCLCRSYPDILTLPNSPKLFLKHYPLWPDCTIKPSNISKLFGEMSFQSGRLPFFLNSNMFRRSSSFICDCRRTCGVYSSIGIIVDLTKMRVRPSRISLLVDEVSSSHAMLQWLPLRFLSIGKEVKHQVILPQSRRNLIRNSKWLFGRSPWSHQDTGRVIGFIGCKM